MARCPITYDTPFEKLVAYDPITYDTPFDKLVAYDPITYDTSFDKLVAYDPITYDTPFDKLVAYGFQIELEFTNVGFCGGRKTGVTVEKTSEQG